MHRQEKQSNVISFGRCQSRRRERQVQDKLQQYKDLDDEFKSIIHRHRVLYRELSAMGVKLD